MNHQSKASKGRENEVKNILPFWHKSSLFIFLAISSLSKAIYSMGWFKVKRDDCIPNPSDLDIFMQDVTTVTTFITLALLITAIQYLEKR